MRAGQAVFVDTGAWIALALTRDPLHARAVDAWVQITTQGARLHTSVPVMLETFTFLDRHARRDVALAWTDSVDALKGPPRAHMHCRPDEGSVAVLSRVRICTSYRRSTRRASS